MMFESLARPLLIPNLKSLRISLLPTSVGKYPRTANDGAAALSGDDLGGISAYGFFAGSFGQG